MPGDFPRTVDQFLKAAAIPEKDQRISCGICHEPYGSSTASDLPIEMPGCKHMFGSACISSWLEAGNVTCPMCRQQMLDSPLLSGEEENWRQELSTFRAGFFHESARHPLIEQGEKLFVELCEEIVQFIEDPSVNDAEQWFCRHVGYRSIVALGSFERFASVMKGPPAYAQWLAHNLPDSIPNPAVYNVIMAQIDMLPAGAEVDGQMDMPTETLERLAGFYRRIDNSCDALYERLYNRPRESAAEPVRDALIGHAGNSPILIE